MTLWIAVAVASLGCLALKAIGWAVGSRLSRTDRTPPLLDLLPVAVLSAIITTSTVATGQQLVVDSRAAGAVTAVALVLLRAPFIVVVVAACAVAAAVHAL